MRRCNNGWMNDTDHGILDNLGPQLIVGKKIKLTKIKKTAPATWAAKYAQDDRSGPRPHPRRQRAVAGPLAGGRHHDWSSGDRGSSG
jgi:hypothetical protein